MRAIRLQGRPVSDTFRLPLRDGADSICSECQQWGFSVAERNFENRTLYHGDNLPFLRGMNSGTVDLIATDPPFNKNRDFHADPGSLASGARFVDRWAWERDVHQEWVDAIKDDWPGVWQAIENGRVNHSEGMAAFLCWLAIRLIEMHRILVDDGSIYLHIDHTAHAYAKVLMDAIFGQRNFRNEIVWCYRGGGVPRNDFARKHDTILRYSKSGRYTFNVDDVRIPYSPDVLSSDTSRYDKSYRSNKVYSGYRPNDLGKHPEDWWPIQPLMPSDKTERTGYPTQKPLTLYERVVLASSNPGDLVLDPFAGCATTPIAAERLGRQRVGMDIWDGAHEQVIKRLADNRQLLADPDPQVIYTTAPPERTDEDDDGPDVPDLALRPRRVKERWERLSHAEMREILTEAQANGPLVVCAGCGFELPERYMELDHREPRKDGGENVITNRILLCGPCNRTKSNNLTLSGLVRYNRREGYEVNRQLAELAASKARDAAQRCRDEMR
ncbi:MAG: hypothetical protein F4W95_09450 [Chloroflexi bacterium]|nr:hypothetical protein [Chloroflexota bacterium]